MIIISFSMIDPLRQPLITLFLEYNSRINLSAIRDSEGVYSKHILDSLEVTKIVDFWSIRQVADIGTGGWFPLLPLAISFPWVSFVGIDSVRKKLQAIHDMCSHLSLDNVECVWSRIEDIHQSYEVVTARAVAHISKLLPWVHNLLKPWSLLILYKQNSQTISLSSDTETQSEYQTMIDLLPSYGLILEKEHHYTLFPWDISRVIYLLRKL